MRKCGKGTLLLMSAVMATSLFTGCGKGKSSQAQKNEVYATIKKSDQSASAAQICACFLTGQKIIGCFRMKEWNCRIAQITLPYFQTLLEV